MESLYGCVQNAVFSNNVVTATGLSASGGNPSLGVFCTWSAGGTGSVDNARVNEVCFKNNTATAWYDNYFHRLINRSGNPGTAAFLSYECNTGSGAGGLNFRLWPTDGYDDSFGEEDHLLIAKHVGGYNISLANLGPYPGPTITEIA